MAIRPTHRCIHATADQSMPRRCAGNPKVHPVHSGTKLITARLAARRCAVAQDRVRKTSGRMFTVSRSATIEPCWTVAMSRWPNGLGRIGKESLYLHHVPSDRPRATATTGRQTPCEPTVRSDCGAYSIPTSVRYVGNSVVPGGCRWRHAAGQGRWSGEWTSICILSGVIWALI